MYFGGGGVFSRLFHFLLPYFPFPLSLPLLKVPLKSSQGILGRAIIKRNEEIEANVVGFWMYYMLPVIAIKFYEIIFHTLFRGGDNMALASKTAR